MISVKSLCAIGVASALFAFAGTANAATSSGSMLVSAVVLENCTIVASSMVFGSSLTTVGTTNVDSTALLTLACTPNADFFVAMDNGSNALSGARRMKGALVGDFLPYEIYTGSDRSTRWGTTAGTDTVAGTAPLGVATMTAYGRIAASAAPVSADTYTDTVTVTVNF